MKKKNYKYPLLENAFSDRDILCGINVLKSKKITMQKKTFDFENYFLYVAFLAAYLEAK